jgi:hypothetical protein
MRPSRTIGGGLLALGLAIGCRTTQPQPEGCATCGNPPPAVPVAPAAPTANRVPLIPAPTPLVPRTPSLVTDDLPIVPVPVPRATVAATPRAMPQITAAPVAQPPVNAEQSAPPSAPMPVPVIVQKPVLTERSAVPAPQSAWVMPEVKAGEQGPRPAPVPAATTAPIAGPAYYNSPDYSILCGVLDFNARRGTWKLRFADAGEEDRYGGSVTLDSVGRQMQDFTSGQTVRVEGALIDPDSRDVSPAYRVKDMRPATPGK